VGQRLADAIATTVPLVNNPGFCNGPLDVKPPSDHLAAGFRLLSVVGAKAATSCDQKGAGEPI
jgi:hypothetical protein